jgi:lysophospholipase L1-like esterase
MREGRGMPGIPGVALLTASVLAWAAISIPVIGSVALAAPGDAPSGTVSWLSAGDSYSAGEGISGSGTDGDPHTCARSDLAYGPRAAAILTSERGWSINASAFPACTGATTDEFYNTGAGGHPAQWDQAAQASNATANRFDVITMSFGGNDVKFADILTGCFTSWGKSLSWTGMVARGTSCDVNEDQLHQWVDDYIAGKSTAHPGVNYGPGTPLTVPQFYEQIASTNLTDRGALIVVGYPQLFTDPDDWASWRGLSCNMIDKTDARELNSAATYLNDQIKQAVEDANDRLGSTRVRYIDREDLFHGHELCTDTVEYLNGLTVTERIEHSFHPNDIGHQVTAETVAGAVADHLAASDTEVVTAPTTPVAAPSTSAQPRTSPTPTPISDGTSHFDIGDAFASDCVVAWPTAPTYTSTSIVMTMDCRNTPDQFLLTQVTYGDPDLPITPNTGTVQVKGTIVDYAQSTYGFRELIVEADSVTW